VATAADLFLKRFRLVATRHATQAFAWVGASGASGRFAPALPGASGVPGRSPLAFAGGIGRPRAYRLGPAAGLGRLTLFCSAASAVDSRGFAGRARLEALSGRAILHVDMDAFFASVEQRDDPSLRGRPVVVGGPSRRGVVCAASYEARPYGVRSAMSMVEALQRCPQAVVVPPRREAYAEASRVVFGVFRRYTPLVQGLSVDEAFLDVSASRSLFGSGAEVAVRIKAEVFKETGLTASAGVAPCKFAAKVASDLQKPNGLVVVGDDVARFLAPLPVERMWGVGPKTAPRLRAAGLATLGDLAAADLGRLVGVVGRSLALHVHALAKGDDPRPVDPDVEALSVGSEDTFERDVRDRAALERHLLDQSGRVASRLFADGLRGRVVVVKLKYADFTLKTRRATLADAICDTASIYRAALTLLDRFDYGGEGVRLSGVAVSGLEPLGAEAQGSLFGDGGRKKNEAIERVVAGVRARFGGEALKRAELLALEGSVGELDPRRK
jgi:DNA polymerase IV